MNTVIHGPYGWYYPYTDEKGKTKGLKLFDEYYDKYYKPGHLTDQHLEAMINGATVTITMPKKNGNGTYLVHAKVINYTTQKGYPCKIIQFEYENFDDRKTILANAEKIVTSYWNSSTKRFDYTRPQATLDKLDLEREWKTWSEREVIANQMYGKVKVYRARSRSNDEVKLYCKIVNDVAEMVTEDQYIADTTKAKEKAEAEREEYLRIYDAIKAAQNKANDWLNSVIEQIWPGGASIGKTQLIENIDKIVANVNVANIDDLVVGLVSSSSMTRYKVSEYFDKARHDIYRNIDQSNYQDPTAAMQKIKDQLYSRLKVYSEYSKITLFRDNMYNEYNSSGLDAMTAGIDIDTALSLGYFPQVQKILVKYKQDAPKYIIYNMYKDVINLTELKDKLLNLLKVYYDFYDMPEKDRKAIAKYVATHKLSDYYARVSSFDEVLETLIDNSRDPKLTKPLLESIAGTSRANVLKDKTYYFAKRGRLRNNILLYKPIDLLENLRALIKEFNVSSGVAILTNIELDNDESFIFQFYTFADTEGDEKGFDGRRMLNLTKIYNRQHPNEKIGFSIITMTQTTTMMMNK